MRFANPQEALAQADALRARSAVHEMEALAALDRFMRRLAECPGALVLEVAQGLEVTTTGALSILDVLLLCRKKIDAPARERRKPVARPPTEEAKDGPDGPANP